MDKENFLNNFDEVLYPETQSKFEELEKIKKEEKQQRKAEYIKNHPEQLEFKDHKKGYKKLKAKEKNYNRRQKEKEKNIKK